MEPIVGVKMNTGRILLALLALSIWGCRTSAPVVRHAAVPGTAAQQLAQQNVDAVIWQNSSAEAFRLYQQCYELARIRLDQNLARPHGKPPAVVVDIDETVLDNSPSNAQDALDGTGYTPARWKHWTALARAKALPGAVAFLDYAASKGCAVFYISNREMDEEAATIHNLREKGFPMADSAHVMPMQGTGDKTARRAEVAKDHYIALLVGDQLTDFDEHFHHRGSDLGKGMVNAMHDTLEQYFIMLPNPMYGAWLNAVTGHVDSLKLGNKEGLLRSVSY